MQKNKISIVIPTFNEKKYLPKLLQSIKKNSIQPLEIIVADANSKDKTIEIAKSFDCKVVKGGIPAVARNNGAKVAKGNLLLFLDADVLIPENFIKEIYEKFTKNNLAICSCFFLPTPNKKIDYLLHSLFSYFVKLREMVNVPVGPGACLLIKKDIHNKVKGFNENIFLAEDLDYINRVTKLGKYKFFLNPRFYHSTRRIEKDGIRKILWNYLLLDIEHKTKGKIKVNKNNYLFGHYDE